MRFGAYLCASLLPAALASVGDRSQAYHDCVLQLHSMRCSSVPKPSPLPWSLRFTFWSCTSDCMYLCQQQLTDNAEKGIKQPGLPQHDVVQFHGKWPFRRLWGMQEPASVLFSVLNMAVHVTWMRRLRDQLPRSLSPPLRQLYFALPYFGINTWVWSVVFHMRDTVWTERMDYFSAAAGFAFWLYFAIIRIAGPRLYGQASSSRRKRQILAFGMTSIFLAHCSYLVFWKFDYAYNMMFNIGLGIAHNLLWYGWSVYNIVYAKSAAQNPHVWQPIVILTLLSVGTALELLDFPPYKRVIDAHSLWHLSTIPIIHFWYCFYLADARWLARQNEGKLKR